MTEDLGKRKYKKNLTTTWRNSPVSGNHCRKNLKDWFWKKCAKATFNCVTLLDFFFFSKYIAQNLQQKQTLIYNIMPLHQKQSNRTKANLQSLGGCLRIIWEFMSMSRTDFKSLSTFVSGNLFDRFSCSAPFTEQLPSWSACSLIF